MQTPNDIQTGMVLRLRSAAGHLNAVIGMVDRQAPCAEVLHQLCAVQAALDAARRQILGEQLRFQLEEIERNCSCPNREQTAENLKIFYTLLAKSEVV